MSLPESLATTSAREVAVTAAYRAARAAIDDLLDSGQIESHDALSLTEGVSKALQTVPQEAGEIEVLKSLSYGAMTTDSALMTGGAALTLPSLDGATLSEYGRRRIAKALYDDTMAGESPVSKALGYEPPEDMDEFRTDVADCFMQEFGVGADDGLACAEMFFGMLAGR